MLISEIQLQVFSFIPVRCTIHDWSNSTGGSISKSLLKCSQSFVGYVLKCPCKPMNFKVMNFLLMVTLPKL